MSKLNTVSELFSISQGSINSTDINRPDKCHYCASCCGRDFFHDDQPAMPFTPKNKSKAKCPSNAYICSGCYLWKRKRVTVKFLDDTFRDVQCAMNHSWYITGKDARAIKISDRLSLYHILLKPENSFALSLLSGDTKDQNQLHLNILNDIAEIKGDTLLHFTINNVPFTYTIYDLESALRSVEVGQSPGVRELIKFCGPFSLPPLIEKEDRRGPPKTRGTGPLDTLKREIKMSGKD